MNLYFYYSKKLFLMLKLVLLKEKVKLDKNKSSFPKVFLKI